MSNRHKTNLVLLLIFISWGVLESYNIHNWYKYILVVILFILSLKEPEEDKNPDSDRQKYNQL